jgi:hypothetical protein
LLNGTGLHRIEYKRDPKVKVALLEATEALAKSQIANDIKGDKVVPKIQL